MRQPTSFLVKLCLSGTLLAGTAWPPCLAQDGNQETATDYAIDTVAGSGERGFSGDGGPAVQAMLRSPSGVAVDRAGNLYIADTSNYRIRQVDPSGIITTFAGTGQGQWIPPGPSPLTRGGRPVEDALGRTAARRSRRR